MLGVTSIAVPYPRLTDIKFAMDAKYVVDGTNTMEIEGFSKLFAKGYFLAKHLELKVVGGVTNLVEAAFADGKEPAFIGVWFIACWGGRRCQMPGVPASCVDAVLYDTLASKAMMVGVEVNITITCHLSTITALGHTHFHPRDDSGVCDGWLNTVLVRDHAFSGLRWRTDCKWV